MCNKEMIVRSTRKMYCKECKRIHYNNWRRLYYRITENKEKHSKIVNKWQSKNKNKVLELNKEWRKKNKKIVNARSLARIYVPLKSSCEICKSKKRLQRHHWTYDKPKLVNTLCQECHTIQHIKDFKNSTYGGNLI